MNSDYIIPRTARHPSLMKRMTFAVLSLCSLVLSSCGSIVDSPDVTPQENRTVMNVAEYYFKLQIPNTKYQYTAFSPDSSTVKLNMRMLGEDQAYPTFRNATVYECEWIYSDQPDEIAEFYYALSDSEAYSLGYEAGPDSPYWLDLKAPLYKGASWEFPDMDRELTNAVIKRMGFPMKIDNTLFSDVLEVEYTNQVDGSVTTKFFAHDVGLIYMRKANKEGKELYSTRIIK